MLPLRGTHQFLFPTILALLLVGSMPPARALAQASDQGLAAQGNPPATITIRRASYAIDDAVRITGFVLDGKTYDLSKTRVVQFETTSGWLERLEVIVHNNVPKTMVAGSIQINCPSLNHGPKDQMVVGQFTLGSVPDRFRFPSGPQYASHASTKPPISVEGGKDLSFVLGKDFDRMRELLSQRDPYPDCTVDPLVFHFSDETMWQPGTFYKPDPNSDRGYVKIPLEEFLGRTK
jgi:hypothetical protein